MKKELAYTWCRLNDPDSWYHKNWKKEEEEIEEGPQDDDCGAELYALQGGEG